MWLATRAAGMTGNRGLQVIPGHLLAKEKGRKGRERSQNLVTYKGQHYWEIGQVVANWEYLKGLPEAPLP